MVPETGLEPVRPFTGPRILSPLRLPFHHSGDVVVQYCTKNGATAARTPAKPYGQSAFCNFAERKLYRACISKTSSPPDMMSAWWIFQSVIGLPFSVTDFTYLFSRDRFLAMTVNVLH